MTAWRGTGRTTRMLEEALLLRGNAEQLPILIYGANEREAERLLRAFVCLAEMSGASAKVVWGRRRSGHDPVLW